MNLFSHITELGLQGYHLLPVSLMVSDKVILWSPNSEKIERAYTEFSKSNSTAINPLMRPGDLLELVNERRIQILGREDWLRIPESRLNNKHKPPNWDPVFDTSIRDFGVEDVLKNVPDSQKRVRFVPPEKGYEWADKIMKSNAIKNKKIVAYIIAKIKSNDLPEGVLDKVKRIDSDEGKIRVVLRDVRNHYDAFRFCGAQKTIDGVRFDNLISSVLGDEITKSQGSYSDYPNLSGLRVLEVLEVLKSIAATKPRNAEQIKKLCCSKKGEILRNEFEKLISIDKFSAVEVLTSDLRGSLGKVSGYLENLIPGNLMDKGMTISGILLSLATFTFNPLSYYGLFNSCWTPLKGWVTQKSLRPVNSYTGYRSPFIIAYDRLTPTYRQMEEMLKRFGETKMPR